jgi:hypothetical protein
MLQLNYLIVAKVGRGNGNRLRPPFARQPVFPVP